MADPTHAGDQPARDVKLPQQTRRWAIQRAVSATLGTFAAMTTGASVWTLVTTARDIRRSVRHGADPDLTALVEPGILLAVAIVLVLASAVTNPWFTRDVAAVARRLSTALDPQDPAVTETKTVPPKAPGR